MKCDTSNYFRNPSVEGDPIVEAIEQLQSDVERIDAKNESQDTQIEGAYTEIDILDNKLDNLPITNHILAGNFYDEPNPWYHVDSQFGDDSNDGRSWDTPLRTFDKAIDLANKNGRHDLRVALLQSPVAYELSGASLASQVLHVYAYDRSTKEEIKNIDTVLSDVPVVLRLTNTERRTALYSTHTNLQGLTIEKVSTPATATTAADSQRELYCDGGMVLFTACVINGSYTQNGGSTWLNNVVAEQLTFRSCEVWVEDNSLLQFTSGNSHIRKNADGSPYQGGNRLSVIGGVLHASGSNSTIKFANQVSGDSGRFLRLLGAVVFANNFIVGSCNAQYDISIDNCICYIPTADRNKFSRPLISDCILFSGNSVAAGSGQQTDWSGVSNIAYT